MNARLEESEIIESDVW